MSDWFHGKFERNIMMTIMLLIKLIKF